MYTALLGLSHAVALLAELCWGNTGYYSINQKPVIASQVEKWANGENERIKGILILIIIGCEIRM